MKIFTQTDIGQHRETNQDSCRYGYLTEDCSWAVVCDGMGGHNGGNIASDMTTDIVSGYIVKNFNNQMDYNEIKEMLKSSVEIANNDVYNRSLNENELSGMGTTLELALCYKNKMIVCHVGDSRSYLIRENKIIQLSKDHSLVQELIDNGEMTKQQADESGIKNVITNALGVFSGIKIDFIEFNVEKDDVIILASDGLTNHISDNELKDIVLDKKFNACQTLINTANRNDGSDNITVALMFVE